MTLVITSPVDFNRSLIRGNPIATSPLPSKTGTLQLTVELVGDEVGLALGVGDGVGVGVGDAAGIRVTGLAEATLCQVNFLFFNTHLNWFAPDVVVLPALEHLSPALIAANVGADTSERTSTNDSTHRFIREA